MVLTPPLGAWSTRSSKVKAGMYQLTVKAFQAAVFLGVLALCWHIQAIDPDAPRNGYAVTALAIILTFILTVLPAIIYRRSEMLFWKLRHWLGASEEPSQAVRIDPVFTKALDHSATSGRITSDSRLGVGD
jgi:hypothetical protein